MTKQKVFFFPKYLFSTLQLEGSVDFLLVSNIVLELDLELLLVSNIVLESDLELFYSSLYAFIV